MHAVGVWPTSVNTSNMPPSSVPTPEGVTCAASRACVATKINYNRCILCGLCIEACPTRALTMTHDYEISQSRREDLIWTKRELIEGVPEGASDTPHRDREVKARGLNYYGGLAVTPPTLHGGSYEGAANAPSARAGTVVPSGSLPSTDEEPADPATVGGATTDRPDARGEAARDPRG